jgi:hypothetical protein
MLQKKHLTVLIIIYRVLLAKLKFYGINVNDYALYKSYLENRYQRTAPYNDKRQVIKSLVGLKYYMVSHIVLFWDLYFFSYTQMIFLRL